MVVFNDQKQKFNIFLDLDFGFRSLLSCKTNQQWSERKQQAKQGFCPTNEQQWSEMELEWPENGGNNGNIMKNYGVMVECTEKKYGSKMVVIMGKWW